MRGVRNTLRKKRKQNAGMIAVDPNVIIDRIRTEYLPGTKRTKLLHFAGHPDRWSSTRPALWISEDADNYVNVNCGKDEGKSKDCATRDFIWIESIREALVSNPRLTNEQLISRFPLPGSDPPPPPRAQPPLQAAPPPRAQPPRQSARQQAAQESERRAYEEEAKRRADEEEAARREAARREAAREAQRRAAEEAARQEALRKAAEEAARQEALRKAAEKAAREAQRKATKKAKEKADRRKTAKKEEDQKRKAYFRNAKEQADIYAMDLEPGLTRMQAYHRDRLEADRQSQAQSARLRQEEADRREAALQEAARLAQENAYFRVPYDEARRVRNEETSKFFKEKSDEMLRINRERRNQFPPPPRPPSWLLNSEREGGSSRGHRPLSLPTRKAPRFSSSKKRRYTRRRLA